ncbi:MAG: MFS transporter [Simkania sp.]|nr:MFS transporter [Simkania sp.]MCB1075236.1 MFS transporter [Simkania sp.]MCP5491265.1 MFS transporter [Chlamydiales bacterium]
MKARAGRSPSFTKLLSIIGICSGCVMMGLVFTMVNATIPVIQQALGVPLHQMQWMMMVFGLINCAFLVTSGRLADMLGRKKVFLVGLTSSGIGMLIGGLSHSGIGLITSMSFAGLGNAILLPVSQAMLVSEFPEAQKSHAVGIWAAAIACAMALGPLVGGIISIEFGWRWVFWSVIPVFIISLILIALFSKDSKNTVDPPVGDYKGMFFLGIGLTTSVLAATESNRFPWVVTALLSLIAVLAFLALWKNSKTITHPILLPQLIRNRTFLSASVGSACLVFYIWATFFLLPIYLQEVRQLSSLGSGLIMLAITIPVVILSPIVGKRYQAHNAWIFALAGFICLLVSSTVQGTLDESSQIFLIVLTLLIFGVGYGLIFGPTATAAISTVPPHKAGIASGSFVTVQEIGGTLGLALVVTTVRLHTPLMHGLQKGDYVLIGISLIGCIACLFLKPRAAKRSR